MLTMFAVCVACIGTLLVGGDAVCRTNIKDWVPYYPNATVVSEEYSLVRPQALGTTQVVLSSPDDVETVKQFYRDRTLENLRQGVTRGIANTGWQVEENPDGEGSIIRLYSTCE